MPIPKIQPGEDKNKYISRCISKINEEYDHDQAVAICIGQTQKMSEDIFVLKPKKAENRGIYLSRCMKNNKMRLQFPSMKERGAFCLSSFNEFYKYWQKQEDFGDIPKDSTLGQCIAQEKAKGSDYRTAYAKCSTKVVAPSGPVVLSDDDDIIEEPVLS